VSDPTLKRSIGVPLLTLYGLGTILGAGIYVLIGEVAGAAGMAAPSAFLLAAFLAGVTAFSYAELSARLPMSAGEAAYVDAGFGRPALSVLVGWGVIFTGIVSAATMVRGFVGYLAIFVSLPDPVVIVVAVAVLGGLAAWGISESLTAAALVTLLEVAGLIFVCVVAGGGLATLPDVWPSMLPDISVTGMTGLLAGAFLAFYAFIGFEDMVNVAEEVKKPRRTLPRSIILALVLSSLLYLFVAVVAVTSLPPAELAGDAAPLATIVAARGYSRSIIAAISLFAVLNGALIQIIMASRVLYGLSNQGRGWSVFARVNSRTRTPLFGTTAVALVVLLLSLLFSLGGLARATSFVALFIFAMVNAALWRLKRRGSPEAAFEVPTAVPVIGFLLCVGMLGYQAVARVFSLG
jgi:amino acid transporter